MDFIWGNMLMGSIFTMIGAAMLITADTPNPKFGYNMPSALKSKARKIEADKYAGKILIIAGVVSMLIGILLNLLITTDNWSDDKLMGINIATLMITSMSTAIISIALTEKHLQDVFDDEK